MTTPNDYPTSNSSFYMLEPGIYGKIVQYVFMCDCERVFVDINAGHLEGPGSLLEEFEGFAADLDDPEQFNHALALTSSTSSREPRMRTFKLAGLVMWDDDSDGSLMGLLIGYIEGKTLQSYLDAEERADKQAIPRETKLRWMAQVETTVRQLRTSGIVRGDVKLDDVMIDTEGNAVMIDFGGGYTPDFIPPELQQTAQGDLAGLRRMLDMMGLSSGPNEYMNE
ncbi:hypothetical protein F5Y19DRAFT_472430 [Xylariaceae sp. FL1651]|nr:hypothetical protein F5Y19DRAFT_472430 [Xylariaceae sp. FL1651]